MIAAALLRSSHTYWAALAAALVMANCATSLQRDGARRDLAELRTATAQAEAMRSETARIAEASHRARERAHTEAIQTATQKAHHENRRLAAELQRTLDSLHDRPDRPAGGAVPPPAADGLACTGAQLYRPDAEFLVRESTRADQLRAELATCHEAYDAAVTLTAPP